ncbi:MAG: HDOD domain-containing protein [Clostridia bacterium]|nr:HDOD domain-containing protein [Clostridia bacterium]
MYAYVARQPIFNIYKEVVGYELLYRDGKSGNAANIVDGDAATYSVLSDAITLFGLPMLTNKHRAFVNFTRNLIMNDFVFLTNCDDIVVELLEDVNVDPVLIKKLEDMKQAGYILALDDYAGDPRFDVILPLLDIVKVDFELSPDRKRQRELAEKLMNVQVTLLAEKVETLEDFDAAVDMGFTLFQGYFFEKPRIFNKRIPTLAKSSYGRILGELQKPEVDFDTCAHIVHSDASMTYMLMKKVQSLNYYRGNPIVGIKLALVMMGVSDLRRFILLLLARKNNVSQSDEMVRQAYLRGLFVEKLIKNSNYELDSEQGFLLGMFSLLDRILGTNMEDLLKDIGLDPDVKQALIGGEENIFSLFLQYVLIYEMGNPRLILPDVMLRVDDRTVADFYMECIVNTDATFAENGV